MAIFQPFIQFTSALGTIVVIYFGGQLILRQTLTIADLVAFFLYLELFYQPLHHLSDAWEKIQEATASAERVADLLDQEPEPEATTGALALPPRVQGALAFNNVSFGYSPEESVLRRSICRFPAHSTVALVETGSGVGKTTLASLIPRFYELSKGSITLDGYDLNQLKLSSLHQQISIVLQDVFLFHGTARENILFGRADATEAEVIEAAKIAMPMSLLCNCQWLRHDDWGNRGQTLRQPKAEALKLPRAVLKDTPNSHSG